MKQENREKIKELVGKMSLEEKCYLLSGKDFWQTRSVERVGFPNVTLSDGPHGIRKQEGASDQLGLNGSVPATCYPTAATVANSWNPELGEEIGTYLGTEAASQDVCVLLGPGLNIKRSPLCGRNFEYFSEDPYLAGKMAAGYVRGIQSKGVGACPKHFAANSQELRRMASDSVMDERTLREIYLAGFEIAVKEARPKSIMSSYNRVNGVYANENAHLLQEILRDEWGVDGFVVSDWGASNDHVAGVAAGSHLEMPTTGGDSDEEKGQPFDIDKHHAMARKAAEQSAEYREGLYVGYRYFETVERPVLFPFGYGLSYTTFAYGDLEVSETKVAFDLTNTGDQDGAEVAQLYVSAKCDGVYRPKKELKGFRKVFLQAGETKRVEIPIDEYAFRYFNVKTNQYEVEGGTYEILIGADVSDIRLRGALEVAGTDAVLPYDMAKLSCYASGNIREVPDLEFEALLGYEIPNGHWSGQLDRNDAICQLYYAKSGPARLVYKIMTNMLNKSMEKGKPDLNIMFIYNMPFRAIGKMAGGMCSQEMVDGIVRIVNGYFFGGLGQVIGGFFRQRKVMKKANGMK